MTDLEYPLHQAVKQGDLEEVKTLLKSGEDPNVLDCDGNSPLHHALHSLGLVQTLVNVGADVDLQNSLGQTPLHIAMSCDPVIVSGLMDTVKILIEKRANTNIQDHKGKTPLHILVQRNGYYNNLHQSIPQDVLKLCTLLLNNGANVQLQDKNGQNPLHIAIRCNSQFAGLILDSVSGKSAVNIPNKQGKYPIHIAAFVIQLYFCETTINHIELLIEAGAKINVQDNEGRTPMHYLAEHYRELQGTPMNMVLFKKMSLLLDWGASLTIRDNSNKPPLNKINVCNMRSLKLMYQIRNTCLYSPQNIMKFINEIKNSNGQTFYVSNNVEKYITACCEEVANMKTKNFGDNTLYNVFNQTLQPRYIYNEELRDFVESRVLEDLFPIYKHLIKSTYSRPKLIYEAMNVLQMPLPLEVIEKIFRFVDTNSFRNVINARYMVPQNVQH